MDALVFEPATLSLAENRFLLQHLDDDTVVALHDLPQGPGAPNRRVIKRWLDHFRAFDSLEKARGVAWAGIDKIRDSITRYLAWQERCMEIQQAGGPRHPSQFNWTPAGEMYRGGVGSDAAQMVASEILDNGERRPFGVVLNQPDTADAPNATALMPWVRGGRAPAKPTTADTVAHDGKTGRFTCSVCDFATSYNPKAGRAAQSLARGRMSRHLKNAREHVQRHRTLLRMMQNADRQAS